jgi:dTDP-4-amino-4,6-dideoxygalactose transaminase
MSLRVPFLDRSASYARERALVEHQLDRLFDSGQFCDGELVRELERELELYTGAAHAIAVGNASDALVIMLKAAGIGPGDEVLVPAFTFFATASCVAHVGATPVFCDIDQETYAIDASRLEEKITERTRAIIPVHLFSQMADMPAILEVAARHRLLVLEDSAEAIGMWSGGVHAGLIGQAGVLSFFPSKTLGAFGDAGMVLTHDAGLARACRELRQHGQREGAEYIYDRVGHQSRMDSVQAAVLLARLKLLPADIARRAEIASTYDRKLSALAPGIVTPTLVRRPYSTNPVYYVYLIESEARDELARFLEQRGIGTETYYPMPLHLQPCFRELGHRSGELPVAERCARRTLALPLYPELTAAQLDWVCHQLTRFADGERA